MMKLIRTTLLGGILFLIPLVFVVAVAKNAFGILKVVARPLGNLIPVDSVLGYAVVEILTIAIMVLLCLIAGLIAQGRWAQGLYEKLDEILLNLIPGYGWVKGVTGGIRDDEAEEALRPVMVRFDDQSQLGFEVDRMDGGLVVVYLPGSPDARSGAVTYVEEDRVGPLDVEFMAVVKSLKHLGRGSGAMIRASGSS